MELPLFWNEMYLTVRRDDPVEPLPGAAVGPVNGHYQRCWGVFVTNAENPQPKYLSSNSCFFMQEPRCKVLTRETRNPSTFHQILVFVSKNQNVRY